MNTKLGFNEKNKVIVLRALEYIPIPKGEKAEVEKTKSRYISSRDVYDTTGMSSCFGPPKPISRFVSLSKNSKDEL